MEVRRGMQTARRRGRRDGYPGCRAAPRRRPLHGGERGGELGPDTASDPAADAAGRGPSAERASRVERSSGGDCCVSVILTPRRPIIGCVAGWQSAKITTWKLNTWGDLCAGGACAGPQPDPESARGSAGTSSTAGKARAPSARETAQTRHAAGHTHQASGNRLHSPIPPNERAEHD